MLIHWIWFSTLEELNSTQKLAFLEQYSDPEEFFHTKNRDYQSISGMTPAMCQALEKRDLTKAKEIFSLCQKQKISILTFADAEYPARLRNIDDPPMVLYYKGILPNFEQCPVVAIVGTRKATAYGMTSARNISGQIAACGALVVSGGAYGIDTMAMLGALDAGEPVVGVLGCGVDVVYPKSNQKLFARVVEQGCLMSEYPPGTRPFGWNFPRRNRILSGMSNGVLVVEAPQSSGALITARQASEQGRDVFVVPGNIDVINCEGSNALLQERAIAVFSGWDVVKEYAALYPEKVKKRDVRFSPRPIVRYEDVQSEYTERKVAQTVQSPRYFGNEKKETDKKDIDNGANSHYSCIDVASRKLSQEERIIVEQLSAEPKPVDAVIAQTGLPAAKVLSILTMLGLKGVVINHPGKRVSLGGEIPK